MAMSSSRRGDQDPAAIRDRAEEVIGGGLTGEWVVGP
jgi:hypothetical protein